MAPDFEESFGDATNDAKQVSKIPDDTFRPLAHFPNNPAR
jgi:hypothetical protein